MNTRRPVAAAAAIIALLLSVTPAMAQDAPVKVDPKAIPKLTEENAPKPKLMDRLAAPFKDEPSAKFVDPAKTKPPVPVVAPELPPPPAPLAGPEGKPPVPAAAPNLKPVEATAPAAPAKLNDKKVTDLEFNGKAAPSETEKAPAPPPAPAAKEKVEAQESAPAQEQPVTVQPTVEEKKGLRKYLPW